MNGRSSDAWRLFLASFLGLFVELALIRWIPSAVHVVGFFTNLVLIASFLGLGAGMARPAPEDRSVWGLLFRMAVTVAILGAIHITNPEVTLPAGGDYGLNEATVDVGVSIPLPLILLAVFGLAVWTMIPLGRLIGAYLDRVERIRAYSFNVAGSLIGVAAFSVLAWGSLPPEAWFAVVFVGVLLLDRRISYGVPILGVAVVLVALRLIDSDGFRDAVSWSPYYEIITTPIATTGDLHDGFVMDVNGQFLLSGLDLGPEAPDVTITDRSVADDVELLKSYYSLPFQMRTPGRVLVLGAGAGNDVAAALRNGAEHVTAVEIDPLVLEMGRRYHPEDPYGSPRVTTVLDDARAFLNGTDDRYDLVLFATLDAHGLLSGAANVRLDSFIYTIESLRAARDHLADDGVLVLSFGPFREDVQLRQYEMVRAVFGRDPIYLLHRNGHRTLLAGATDGLELDPLPPGWRRITAGEVVAASERYPSATTPATDDWPHLYIRERRIPTEYLGVLIGMLLIAALLVWRTFRAARRLDGQFFFLGAGFLLMETKSVTQFALLVGSTWQTNSLVFVTILAMILAANVYVLKTRARPTVAVLYALLIAIVIVSYVWPIAAWHVGSGAGTYAAAAISLGIPILLAAVIFAVAFRTARLATEALASNLIGAILGGTLEYLSLAFGIRALSLLAAAMYLAAFGFWIRERSRAEPSEDIVIDGSAPTEAAAAT